MDYVEVAKLRGENISWVMRKEILPNILPPLIAEFGLRFCFVFLSIAALSFLGVGIQPPTADWGSMVRENASLIQFAQYDLKAAMTPLLPAAAIALLTVAVNFVSIGFYIKPVELKMKNKKENSTLLQIKDLKIEGFSDERWHKIIKGVNLELKRGECSD